MSTIRSLLAASALLALGPALSGCGQAEPGPDAATRYTPESLARELAFRFEDLRVEARTASARTKPAVPARPLEGRAEAKTADTAKAATAPTLDDILGDIADKAGRVEGRTRAEVLKAIATTIDAEPSMKPADKKTLLDGLKSLSDRA